MEGLAGIKYGLRDGSCKVEEGTGPGRLGKLTEDAEKEGRSVRRRD